MGTQSAKAAGANGGHRDGFIAENWKPLERKTLRGFLTIVTPSGLKINDVTLHERDGKRWIGLPGKPYAKQDGSTAYNTIIEFESDEARFRLQALALRAVDQLLEGSK